MTGRESDTPQTSSPPELASAKEIISWAMFDFANSSYSTVVMTTIFNTYFVGVVAGSHILSQNGLATLLWTVAVAVSNLLIVASAPILGAFADYSGAKKLLLAITTICCAIGTALMSLTHAGTTVLAMLLIILTNFAYGTGENLIAAFLTEISSREKMGRISAIGLALGYFGGPVVLAICLGYIHWAQGLHYTATQYVPACMVLVACIYALGTIPTFLWLRERVIGKQLPPGRNFAEIGFSRLLNTVSNAKHFKDLFRFLVTVGVFSCGISTVIIIAAIYAQQVVGFGTQETILMILVVNITAAIGAWIFGNIQDKIGSVSTLKITLSIWSLAIVIGCFITDKQEFWLVAFLIGIAMGSTQSSARALIGQFSPAGRSAEFFGLWGLAVKLASIIGPISFGLISFWTGNNQRLALISTAIFFVVGLILMTTVNEKQGIAAALADTK